MLSNLHLRPQADASDAHSQQMDNRAAQQHRGNAMAETVSVSGCNCAFCVMHHEMDDDAEPIHIAPRSHSQGHAYCSLPSTRSIIRVLYPPSYLGAPSPFPDPPSYSPSDFPYAAREDNPVISPLISSTTMNIPSRSPIDPLAQDPSLTGVPSQGTPFRRIPLVEPNSPVVDFGADFSEEIEPLPIYSRVDQRRPRFPAASDVLGPYPPLSALRQAAR